MPFFSSKFSPKKNPIRKQNIQKRTNVKIDDLFDESGHVKLKLGNVDCTFNNGEWIPGKKTRSIGPT